MRQDIASRLPTAPNNQVIILVGPKGSGKTTIGALLASEFGIQFVRVESLFLEVGAHIGSSHPSFERCGFERVLSTLRRTLSQHDSVCFESTGASQHFLWLVNELAHIASVFLVRIVATQDQCTDRIRNRNPLLHIPVSDDRVAEINSRAVTVNLAWAAEIDNSGPLNCQDILSTIRHLRQNNGNHSSA